MSVKDQRVIAIALEECKSKLTYKHGCVVTYGG